MFQSQHSHGPKITSRVITSFMKERSCGRGCEEKEGRENLDLEKENRKKEKPLKSHSFPLSSDSIG